MVQKRLEWVDCLKFLGIFAIYIGHVTPAGKIQQFVFLYHVPLFFFVSGLFANYKERWKFYDFFKIKCVRLMLPYFAFTFLNLLINTINYNFDFMFITAIVKNIVYGVRNSLYVGSLWFINCLFIITLLDYIACSIYNNKYVIFIFSLGSHIYTQTIMSHNPLFEPRWFMNMDSALAYWWALAFGRITYHHLTELLKKNNKFSYSVLSGFLIATFAFIMITMKSPLYLLLHYFNINIVTDKFFSIINYLTVTILLITANIIIAKFLSASPHFCMIGRNTLNICGFESITKLFLPSFFSLFGVNIIISSPISTIIYAAACLYFSHQITRYLSKYIGSIFTIR